MAELDLGLRQIRGHNHARRLRETYAYALKYSQDPYIKVGALIWNPNHERVISMGANRFPEGLHPTPKQIEDIEWKLKHITHAETNAIFRAARNGEKTEGAIMYMPWFPCFDCASAIVDSGIKQIVGHQAMIVKTPEEWFDNMRESRKLLKNARVECSFYDERIGGVNAVFNGEIWHP